MPDLRLVHNINVCMPSLPSSFVHKGEQILFSHVGSKFFHLCREQIVLKAGYLLLYLPSYLPEDSFDPLA